MEALLSVTLDFDKEFSRDKQQRGLVDYSDLEHYTAQLLTYEQGQPTELARQISKRYTEIMVDEYQDVSRVQDAIFRAVSKDGKNLFMVGDVKQSIYRFRLADPEIFTEKYLSYRDYEQAEPGESRRILLRENFRSRKEVLDGANAVFSLCMSRRLGDMDYDEAASLKYGASYPGQVDLPELILIDTASDDEDSPNRATVEAQFVAKKIRALIDSGYKVASGAGERNIEYGDIAILLRSANAVGPTYRQALIEQGIPVASVQGGGYFKSIEVSTMMSMLAVLDNPHQDIPLIAVLRSPAFGFSADELSEIRSSDRQSDFYTALVAAAETKEKYRDFLTRLDALRDMAMDMPMAELVWQLLNELDMLAICSAMEDGQQRRANLMAFIELSERYESSGYRGLHRFVLWLNKLSEKGQEPMAGGLESSAVQIMSIHKSKGLEFPVVFLCDTAKHFNKQDSMDTVLVHPVLGLGPKLTDTKAHVEYPTLARIAIKQRLNRETLSEEMRLLYVAMTRAKERLFITAAMKNPAATVEKAASAVAKPMPPEVLSRASSMATWLIYAALADGGEHLAMSYANQESAEQQQVSPEESVAQADKETLEKLEKNLSFVYPYEESVQLPSKITATELKGQMEPDPEAVSLTKKPSSPFRMPDFTKKDRALTGTEKGVATHLVLQYMDFSKGGSKEEIQGEVDRLCAQGFITKREAEAVDVNAVRRLFASSLGKRMLSCKNIMREFKFSLLCDAQEIYGTAEGEQLLLQGVVDCCLDEGDGLVIIDYKTDRVRTEEEIAQRGKLYRGQLISYARAMERIHGKRVKQCLLYFISAGKTLEIT
jgi:ATP-dependent helicase/nuclease subunit A